MLLLSRASWFICGRYASVKDRRGERRGRKCEGVWGRATGGVREVVGERGRRIGQGRAQEWGLVETRATESGLGAGKRR